MNDEQREALATVLAHYGSDPRVRPLRALRDQDDEIQYLRAELGAAEERHTALVREIADVRALSPGPTITVSVDSLPGMSPMNRTIAYCAADTLRKLGYAWNGEAWEVQP